MRDLNTLVAVSVGICIAAAPIACRAQTGSGYDLPRLLPEDLEIKLALSALPAHLREEASVYVLRRKEGFVEALAGSNAYTCYVQRTLWYRDKQHPDALIPMCFDEVGAEVYTPVDFDDAKLREEGLSNEQVQAEIKRRFKVGRYGPPKSTGISFMLSPIQNITNHQGEIFRFVPHYMFYAPGATNEALGLGVPWLFNIPAVNREGTPHSMFIVRAGAEETRLIEDDSKELIESVRAWLDEGSSTRNGL